MLTKEAGVFDRIGRWIAAPRRARQAEQTVGKLEQQLAQKEHAVSDAAHRMGLMEADIGIHKATAEKAKAEAAERLKMLEQYGGADKIKALEQQAATGAQQAQSARRLAWGAGALGAGGLAAAPLAYGAGKGQGEANKARTRNIAFGAGAAAGLAAPQVVRGLGHVARGVSRTGLYPELEGLGGY